MWMGGRVVTHVVMTVPQIGRFAPTVIRSGTGWWAAYPRGRRLNSRNSGPAFVWPFQRRQSANRASYVGPVTPDGDDVDRLGWTTSSVRMSIEPISMADTAVR